MKRKSLLTVLVCITLSSPLFAGSRGGSPNANWVIVPDKDLGTVMYEEDGKIISTSFSGSQIITYVRANGVIYRFMEIASTSLKVSQTTCQRLEKPVSE